MRPPRPKVLRSRFAATRTWLMPALLLTFAPKCLLCLLGYAGIGVALGLGGPEICGEPAVSLDWSVWIFGLTGAAYGIGIVARRRIHRT